jgi:hypothetical protein
MASRPLSSSLFQLRQFGAPDDPIEFLFLGLC